MVELNTYEPQHSTRSSKDPSRRMRVWLVALALTLAPGALSDASEGEAECGLLDLEHLADGSDPSREPTITGCSVEQLAGIVVRLYTTHLGTWNLGQLNAQIEEANGLAGEAHAVGDLGWVIIAGDHDGECGSLLIRIDDGSGAVLEYISLPEGTLTCGTHGGASGIRSDRLPLSGAILTDFDFPGCPGTTTPADPTWDATGSYLADHTEFGYGWGNTGICLEG